MQVSESIVKLNVGGKIFHTNKETLKGVFFENLLSGNWKENPQNEIFIDRDPVLFRSILLILRGNTLNEYSHDILQEAINYYGINIPNSVIPEEKEQVNQPEIDDDIVNNHQEGLMQLVTYVSPRQHYIDINKQKFDRWINYNKLDNISLSTRTIDIKLKDLEKKTEITRCMDSVHKLYLSVSKDPDSFTNNIFDIIDKVIFKLNDTTVHDFDSILLQSYILLNCNKEYQKYDNMIIPLPFVSEKSPIFLTSCAPFNAYVIVKFKRKCESKLIMYGYCYDTDDRRYLNNNSNSIEYPITTNNKKIIVNITDYITNIDIQTDEFVKQVIIVIEDKYGNIGRGLKYWNMILNGHAIFNMTSLFLDNNLSFPVYSYTFKRPFNFNRIDRTLFILKTTIKSGKIRIYLVNENILTYTLNILKFKEVIHE